ncbi:MAG: hypothetical protein F6J95_022630 [Leptolyngbya sp. SIO1E4]|nr:hypothetical protein [Leptolyngbya sp. SIO1E4]
MADDNNKPSSDQGTQPGKYSIYAKNMSGTHIGDVIHVGHPPGNAAGSHQPSPSKSASPEPPSNIWADAEFKQRSQLFKQLSALPKPQFEELLFTLKLPQGIVSGAPAAQGERVADLLGWAEGASGCGLDTLETVLKMILEL